jgi:Domain of unknown function (DUF4136)
MRVLRAESFIHPSPRRRQLNCPSYEWARLPVIAASTGGSMKKVIRILIGLSVALLLPMAAPAQKVTYDVAQFNGFPRVSTYAFKDNVADEKEAAEATNTYDSPLIEARTREAVAAQLQQRGLRRDDAHPDVYVAINTNYKTEVTYYAYPDWGLGYGYGWGYGPWYTGWGPYYGASTWYAEERILGTLAIDVSNAKTGQLMWRGVAEKHVHEHASPEHRTERVYKAVAKIFRTFPTVQPVATSGSDVPKPTGR